MYEQWPLDVDATASSLRVGPADDPSNDETAPYEAGSFGRWLVDLSRGTCDAAGSDSSVPGCVDVRSVERLQGEHESAEQSYRVSLTIARGDGAHTWGVRADLSLTGRVDTRSKLLVRAKLSGSVHVQASSQGKQEGDPGSRSVYDRPVSVTIERACEPPR